ncbi:MAG: hypothetical protein WKG07_36845 [Hymenobacter sp.]
MRTQGYVLHLEEDGPDRLRVLVQARGPAAPSETLYLLGHTGQRVVVAAGALLQQGRAEFSVSRQQLSAGISHFTLFNRQRQPLCERLYFRPARHAGAPRAAGQKPVRGAGNSDAGGWPAGRSPPTCRWPYIGLIRCRPPAARTSRATCG